MSKSMLQCPGKWVLATVLALALLLAVFSAGVLVSAETISPTPPPLSIPDPAGSDAAGEAHYVPYKLDNAVRKSVSLNTSDLIKLKDTADTG
ncbi:MAG: hypothetical protein LBQ48_06105, partial [Oscillospiraceae bacterium]|nr:hypothetical protein [Oscillospiraceae bacterium]